MHLFQWLRLVYRAWKARGRDQSIEVGVALAYARPGGFVVDAGANKGAYVFWLRNAVGPSGKVIAFEPQPTLAAYLRDVGKVGGWTNVEVRELALSDHAGTSALHLPGGGVTPGASLEASVLERDAAGGTRVDVRVSTLDAELQGLGPLQFLKVDVEGHELALFRGAEQTLRRDMPPILFECEERHLTTHHTSDVFAFLQALGYRGFFLDRRGTRPVSEFDPAVHQARAGEHFWKRPEYRNNFLFVPRGSVVPFYEGDR